MDPNLSYSYGKSQGHLVYSTVMKELGLRLDKDGDELAYISQAESKKVTLREFDRDVSRLSKSLLTRFNLSKGDSLALYAYNCYNWLVVQFACARIGVILVPVNPSNKPQELIHVLKSGKPKCIFFPGPKSVQTGLNNHLEVLRSREISEALASGDLMLKDVVFMDGIKGDEYDLADQLLSVTNCRLHTWADCMKDGIIYRSLKEAEAAGVNEKDAHVVDIDIVSPDDPFAIYYTSGTTGLPKGAVISHFTALNNSRICFERLVQALPKNEKPIMITTLPFFHILAGILLSFPPLCSGSVLINSSHKYDLQTLIEATSEHGANITTLTPTILIDMLAYIESNNLGSEFSLKTVLSGGAFIPPEVVSRTFKTLKNIREVRIGYGSTENGGVATMQCSHEPDETKAISVGGPIDFTELRIVDPDTEKLLPHGEPGEIQTRGHNAMLEYLNQPDKTAEVLTSHRWYRTGDMGIMHPHGSIQVVGRRKSLIIKGGENIYPEEVARYILRLPYVENAHVIGVPDKRYGEQVCAWVKLKPGFCEASTDADQSQRQITKDEVIEFCKQGMTHFKVPKYILFVDSFPMTPTKKAQAHIMVQESIKILGLDKKI